MQAPRPSIAAAWRLLVWLVPISFIAPLSALIWLIVQAVPTAGSPWVQISIIFTVSTIGGLLPLLAASVVAGVFAMKGRQDVAMLLLCGVSAVLLPVAFWPGAWQPPFTWLMALPAGIAFVLALLWLYQIRHGNRGVAIAAVILLAVPVVSFGGVRAYMAVWLAQQCPAGPAVDLTVTGMESAHFSQACGLPLKYPELTGCRSSTATVGLPTGDTFWFLEIQASGPGTVTSEKYPNAAPSLSVGTNKSYGGPWGWRGNYVVDAPCRGSIDADLYSATSDPTTHEYRGPGPPVHVKGHWETPSSN
jgi:hypothetical protein